MTKNFSKEFIQSAEKLTTFNFKTSYFQSTEYKQEIRYLFNKHYFNNENIETLKEIDKDKYNETVDKLKKIDYQSFVNLHTYNLKGIGPGEITAYYLVDDVRLGGGSSAAQDIMITSIGYEMKAASISKDGYAYNFKTGGTVDISNLMNQIVSLKCEMNIPCNNVEISAARLDVIKEKAPKEFTSIEKQYKEIVGDYFSKHKTIFKYNSGKENIGKIATIKKVEEKDVFIERVTSGTIKPKVKI